MATLKLRAIGNSVGVVLPKELLARLNLSEGDSLQVVESPDGLLLTVAPQETEAQLDLGREMMRKYRETFAALAK
ncbi:AbrB/MazE/SpoVT family DNA-binding domain-containing protein [Roseomonas stagni]|uniref:AbrB/MazE/SpoVT family DNA-binding domain-containing protein n=1 Tax=Falsiroseomonas algicola TaxID=2716930 RepID=A0A6M1LPI5_9PROT|nr:AbrB/MazE/SpoVT family DNA-binding domain-containing protein [Falsiroseomonas algicola]NGM21704.1 AbrB/MazE/SpoVT family DNA-binding domain-containing protein [Falsiroseomonas algicola]